MEIRELAGNRVSNLNRIVRKIAKSFPQVYDQLRIRARECLFYGIKQLYAVG